MHVTEGSASQWQPWFAWRPVMLCVADELVPYWYHRTGGWTWLRWIERRTFYAAPWFIIHGWREYRRPDANQQLQPEAQK
jgi:hypothetical protein